MVLLVSILESELTISYDAACVGRQLTKFNGSSVLNLKSLAASVAAASSSQYLKFEFDERRAVLETALSKKTEGDVLRAHDVPSWCSADVDPRGGGVVMNCVTAFSWRGKGGGEAPLPPLE